MRSWGRVLKSAVDLTGVLLGGRYRVVRLLGTGGMGSVYEAVTGEFDRRVAVKVMHAELTAEEEIVQRFKREARAAATLDHPHIVQVTDFVTEPGKPPFLVMEYLVGQSLRDVLKRQRRITAERAARLAVQVLSALGAAHRAQIIHRDIKPDNIFLTSTAAVVDVVKVLDFGVAKLLGDSAKPLTVTGMVIGTLSFMAPEQALGKKVDTRADLYALAATIYFAVSGRKPLDGPNPAELLAAVVGMEPRPLTSIRRDVDPEFAAIIARGLKKDPAARFQTAEAMEQALQKWLEHAPHLRASDPRTPAASQGRIEEASDASSPSFGAEEESSFRLEMPSVGSVFGRYEVRELLGSGGVGEVFRAEDAALGRSVALKVLRVARDETQTGLTSAGAARILREARAAATLDHPNAVAVFDVGDLGGIPYLVMELVPGKNLRRLIGDPSITVERKIGWLIDVARALAGAHKKGVVHQDIKPENVMLRDDDVIKVLDFGIARRIFQHDSSMPGVDMTDRIPGTPAYMAPEQLHGASGDALTDQFAWAVLAYELLVGELPWQQHGGVLHVVHEILTRLPDPPSTRRPEIPREIDRVILRALAKDPADRFKSMDDVVTALTTGWSMASTTAVDEHPEERPRPWRRRGFAMTALAAAGAIGLIGWAIAPKSGPRVTVAPTTSAPAEVGPPDFGSTMSSNPEALAAYRAGMQAIHDAAAGAARKHLERATVLDPAFAAAHLRKVLATPTVNDNERDHLLKATQHRNELSEHDRALLQTIETWVGVPQDLGEVERRLTALTATHRDADYLYQLCRFRLFNRSYARAVDACRAAHELDPTLVGAFWLEGLSQLLLGDTQAGREALGTCLRMSPSATSCLSDFIELTTNEGVCAAAFEYAQRLVASEPEQSESFRQLAIVTYAMGRPIAEARGLYERSWELDPPDQIPAARAKVRTNLAVLTGDFDEASKELAMWERAVERSSAENDHFEPFQVRAWLHRETGQDAAFTGRARAFLASRAAWAPSPRGDTSIAALIALYRGKALSRPDFAAARGEWLARERTEETRSDFLIRNPWIWAYANSVVTQDDALEALAMLAQYQPLPSDRVRTVDADEAVGVTYLTAGRKDEAILVLRRAAQSCRAAEFPFQHTWAHFELGRALEATDVPGACSAYKVVLNRWGANPSSSTAAAARARWSALQCP